MGAASINQPEHQIDSAETRRNTLPAWIIWPTLSLLLYLLSIGPVLKISRSTLGWPRTIEAVYYPLFRVSHLCPPAEKSLYKYLSLFKVPFPLD